MICSNLQQFKHIILTFDNALRVVDPKSGRVLECYTTAPGVQLYTGNYLDMTGKEGVHYKKHAAFCLETQNYPDAINKVRAEDLFI